MVRGAWLGGWPGRPGVSRQDNRGMQGETTMVETGDYRGGTEEQDVGGVTKWATGTG